MRSVLLSSRKRVLGILVLRRLVHAWYGTYGLPEQDDSCLCRVLLHDRVGRITSMRVMSRRRVTFAKGQQHVIHRTPQPGTYIVACAGGGVRSEE
jgi:hypothetical protein